MSRIGKMPITIPAGVVFKMDDNTISVKGPKGELQQTFFSGISFEQNDNVITVKRDSDEKKLRELHGLTRMLVQNMITGVSEGFKKELEIIGVGYRGSKQGSKLVLNLGYSHPVEMEDPDGITTNMEGNNKVIVTGIDKQKVGAYAAVIREKRPPEPYKGKGIRYVGEKVRRKEGKTGKK
jgi:large subunit ribosomal protein L6